jgi:hypothetical protein
MTFTFDTLSCLKRCCWWLLDVEKTIQLIKQSIKLCFTFLIQSIHPHVCLSYGMILYSLNCQILIRGHIQMNSGSFNDNTTDKVFFAFLTFFKWYSLHLWKYCTAEGLLPMHVRNRKHEQILFVGSMIFEA